MIMDTVEVNLVDTLRNQKFISLLLLALLVTYVLPFPFMTNFFHDYSRVKELRDDMIKEHNAIVCHRVLETDPDFFSSQGMKCNDKYYRPDEETVSTGELLVYADTYGKYLEAKRELRRDLPGLKVFAILVFLLSLWFGYSLIDLTVKVSSGYEGGLLGPLLAGLHSLPALVASEALVFAAMFVLLTVFAVPIALFGPVGVLVAGFIVSPAFTLVIPAYYFARRVFPIGEIWRVARGNPGGYLSLGLGLSVVEILTVVAMGYTLSIGLGVLFLVILAAGALHYLLGSLGSLWVYLGHSP
ncbi:hypothetical protein [Thermococcus celer]|nr:hypothetical protein [Thermococcus celer]